MEDQQQRDMRELEQYKTARWLAIVVIISFLVLILACLASLTIVVSTFLAHLPW